MPILLWIFITKTFFQQLNDLGPKQFQSPSTNSPSSSFQTYQGSSYQSSTETPTLSSINSIQENSSLSSNQSSTLTEDPQSSLLGSVKTFSSLPTEETLQTDYGNIFIHIGFLIFFLIIAIFVIIQCSHFAVYIYREAEKRRMRGKSLLLTNNLLNNHIISDRSLPLHTR